MHSGQQGRVSYRLVAWVLCAAFAVATIVGLQLTKPEPLPMPRAEVRGTLFELTIAEDEAAQAKGLGGSESIDWGQAMLFPRSDDFARQCFWMQDMQFPIDIIWLNSESRAVQLLEDFSPESYPDTECGPEGTSHALELRAGSVQRYGIRLDDHVLLTLR